MDEDFSRKLNKRARETGQTRGEVAKDIRDVLFGEPTGLRKWIEVIGQPFRRISDMDKENRRIFEENRQREAVAALREARGVDTATDALMHPGTGIAAGPKPEGQGRG